MNTAETELNREIVSEAEWLVARRDLLTREKEFTRQRDALSAARRQLPMVKVDKDYILEGPKGKETLSDLFDGHSQLVVYHFMLGPVGARAARVARIWRITSTARTGTCRIATSHS